MHRHWAVFGPPAYVAVAAYLGLNRKVAPPTARLDDAEGLADLLAAMPGGARL